MNSRVHSRGKMIFNCFTSLRMFVNEWQAAICGLFSLKLQPAKQQHREWKIGAISMGLCNEREEELSGTKTQNSGEFKNFDIAPNSGAGNRLNWNCSWEFSDQSEFWKVTWIIWNILLQNRLHDFWSAGCATSSIRFDFANDITVYLGGFFGTAPIVTVLSAECGDRFNLATQLNARDIILTTIKMINDTSLESVV